LKPKHWIVFILLGAIWSSSFLWIKIAVREVGPVTLVAFRILFGLVAGVAAAVYSRASWPRAFKDWLNLAFLGILSTSIPFFLISWGEQSIDSAVASVLNASVPLFTIVIAHLTLSDDRMSLPKVLGLLVGFGGVLVLLSEDLSARAHSSALGQVAVVVAALFYAIGSVYARKTTQHLPGMVRGIAPLVSASAVMWMAAPVVESPLHVPTQPITWVALLWLGILGTGLAQVMWYYLLHEIGPTRSTFVTYILPLGGVILGVIFLGEHLSWQLALGTLLIVASIVVVNWKRRAA